MYYVKYYVRSYILNKCLLKWSLKALKSHPLSVIDLSYIKDFPLFLNPVWKGSDSNICIIEWSFRRYFVNICIYMKYKFSNIFDQILNQKLINCFPFKQLRTSVFNNVWFCFFNFASSSKNANGNVWIIIVIWSFSSW